MERVRRLFSNLQCCKSGTEGDRLKSRNDKYLLEVVGCGDEEYEMKTLASPKGAVDIFSSKQISLLRSKSCPEIIEHAYGERSPLQSAEGRQRQSGSPSSIEGVGGGAKRPHSGQPQSSQPSSLDQERPLSQQSSESYQRQRRRRQRRSHQQWMSSDDNAGSRGPGDGGSSSARVEYLHAAGDYNLPNRTISSAPGGVSRP